MYSSPRSTGGMYSKPTSPSGIRASANTSDRNEIPSTQRGRSSPQVSACSTYQPRVRSKRSVNQSIGRHGFQVESSAQRPASVGVTVNETNSEVSVATVTTRPNSRKNSPTEPGRNEIGRKTNTPNHGNKHDPPRHPDLEPPADRGLRGPFAAPEMPLDVLQHDDRVVDQDADDQRHRQQR